MRRPAIFWVDVAVKALLVVLLAIGAFSGAEQFEGKAFGWRLLLYPLSALVVPVAWWAARRHGGGGRYPYTIDVLLVAPFLVDVAGNALDLYDTIDWWDDANHFVNWALLAGAFAGLVLRLRVRPPWVVLGLVVGFGSVAALLWEVGEYLTFVRGSEEVRTAYRDTLGDMVLGVAGAALVGVVAAVRVRREDAA